MSGKNLSIAIIGAGMGGLAAAGTLCRAGFSNVHVYEQAPRFSRIGAGIQMMPNSMKVLRGIGVEDRLRQVAFQPYSHLNRVWDTGHITRELPMPEELFGAPYLCMHRPDLHEALLSAVPPKTVHLGKKLVGLDQSRGQVTLQFEDGTRVSTDAVIACDGIHSLVREIIVGADNAFALQQSRVAYVLDGSCRDSVRAQPLHLRLRTPSAPNTKVSTGVAQQIAVRPRDAGGNESARISGRQEPEWLCAQVLLP